MFPMSPLSAVSKQCVFSEGEILKRSRSVSMSEGEVETIFCWAEPDCERSFFQLLAIVLASTCWEGGGGGGGGVL